MRLKSCKKRRARVEAFLLAQDCHRGTIDNWYCKFTSSSVPIANGLSNYLIPAFCFDPCRESLFERVVTCGAVHTYKRNLLSLKHKAPRAGPLILDPTLESRRWPTG